MVRKPASCLGIPRGEPPWHVFAFFLRVKKEGGPQAKPEKDENCGLSAHKNAVLLKRRSVARPRPFSAWRKDAKRRLGGAPLSTPDGRPVFFSGKPAGTASPEPTPIQQGGPGPPGLDWARGRKKTATPSPGAAALFISVDKVAAFMSIFLKRKSTKLPGAPRELPLARLCLLSSCEESRWPSGQT